MLLAFEVSMKLIRHITEQAVMLYVGDVRCLANVPCRVELKARSSEKDCPCSSPLLKPKEILRSDLSVLETDLTTHEIKDTRIPNLKL